MGLPSDLEEELLEVAEDSREAVAIALEKY